MQTYTLEKKKERKEKWIYECYINSIYREIYRLLAEEPGIARDLKRKKKKGRKKLFKSTFLNKNSFYLLFVQIGPIFDFYFKSLSPGSGVVGVGAPGDGNFIYFHDELSDQF